MEAQEARIVASYERALRLTQSSATADAQVLIASGTVVLQSRIPTLKRSCSSVRQLRHAGWSRGPCVQVGLRALVDFNALQDGAASID